MVTGKYGISLQVFNFISHFFAPFPCEISSGILKGKIHIFEYLHTILHMVWALHQHNNSGLKKTGFRFLKCDI